MRNNCYGYNSDYLNLFWFCKERDTSGRMSNCTAADPVSMFRRGLDAVRSVRSRYAAEVAAVRITGRFRVEPGAMMVLDAPPGTAVRCHEGNLWVTQEGDPRDRVLSAGEQFVPRCRGKVVVQSFAGAVVELAPLPSPRAERADDGRRLPDVARPEPVVGIQPRDRERRPSATC